MSQEQFDFYGLEPKDRSFWEYHQDNPHIYEMFKRFTFQIIATGAKNFGAMAVIQRIRWETATTKEFEPLKINNNYTAGYARMFMRDHAEHDGFFRTRELKSERNQVNGEKDAA